MVIKLIFSIIVPLFLGSGIVAFIYKNGKKPGVMESLALAWGIGIGIVGIVMFLISRFGIPLNVYTVNFPITIITFIFVTYLKLKKIQLFGDFSPTNDQPQNNKWLNILEKVLIALLLLTVLYVAFDAMVKPIVNYDDLWRQGAISRIIYVKGEVVNEQTMELAGPHPYLNPLSQAWIYFGIGAWNDALGKVIFVLCFASLLALFYINLKKHTSNLFAIVFTYLLTSFPLIVYHAGTAYTDLMQAFFYSVGIFYLYNWMKDNEMSGLYISALFFGISNFVKQWGIALWIIASLVLFLFIFIERKKELSSGIKFAGVSALISSIWIIFPQSLIMYRFVSKIVGIFIKPETAAVGPATPPHLPYGPPTIKNVLFHIGRRLFTYADWQLLWFTFFASLVLFWKNIWRSNLKYLLLIITLNFALLIYAFSEPTAFIILVDGTIAQRALMYQIPVVLFFVANLFYFQIKEAK